MGRKVVHFEVMGQDARRLQDFYSQLFDWEIESDNPMGYGVVSTGDDGAIAGGVGGGIPGYAGHVTFYVGVPDLEACLSAAERLGGRRMMGPEKVMEGVEIAQFTDCEGHLVGLLRVPDSD